MGFFSWKTQDTNKSIANKYSNEPTFTVYMVNPLTGEQFEEADYEGYGEFGGKDYYELLAEINGKSTRDEGIDLQFEGNPNGEPIKYPILVEDPHSWEKYVGQQPEECEYQGYFYPEDTEDWETDEDDWDGEEPDLEEEDGLWESLNNKINEALEEI